MLNLWVNHEYKFAWAPIPKCACTSLKKWHLDLMGVVVDHPDRVHAFKEGKSIWGANLVKPDTIPPGYFKFVFVRNPFSRVVSGYIEKILTVHTEGPDASGGSEIRNISIWLNRWAGYETAVTFREFIDYISMMPYELIDEHFAPQHFLLGDVEFDFVGKLETFQKDWEVIQSIVETPGKVGIYNGTNYKDYKTCFADVKPPALRDLGRYPTYHNFFTPELGAKFYKAFEKDFISYGYKEKDD